MQTHQYLHAMPTQLIYIHGFNSSPQSAKAQLLRKHFAKGEMNEFLSVPPLPPSPKAAIALLETEIARYEQVALVGSSLGGFYATWLAEKHDLKAALVNPVVTPWKLLDKYTGIQQNYHTGEEWQLEPAWVDELRTFEVSHIESPQSLLLLTQTGDDTLDWHESWQFYQDCHLFKGLGGSHGFDNFEVFIPLILQFLDIT
jgi:predicted esterase YcpF (UPF0227 family)